MESPDFPVLPFVTKVARMNPLEALIVVARGKPSDAGAVCWHPRQDHGVAVTAGIVDSWRLASNRASKKVEGEESLQIEHGCAEGGLGALETMQATRFAAQLRIKTGSDGPDRLLYSLKGEYKNRIAGVKTEIPAEPADLELLQTQTMVRADRSVRIQAYSFLTAPSEPYRCDATAIAEPLIGCAGGQCSLKRDRGTGFITRAYRLVIRSFLSTVLLLAWTGSGAAQANSLSGAGNQSADEQAKLVHNPLPPIWLLQFQQNNYVIGMPSPVRGNRIHSNLLFQPLLPLKLNDDWRIVFRPVLTLFNSVPYLDQTRKIRRTTGFGDTIFAAALSPRTTVVGSWLLALGPTFIFPTGDTELGQKKWQFGPFSIFGYRGEHFLAYVFSQQWFSIAGNGKKPTSQMSTTYSLVYFFKSGWTVGTQAEFTVNWEAARGNKVAFPIGLQVGYVFHVGSVPVNVDLQPEYYPVHPDPANYGPKWNIQLQVTPIIPILIPGQPNAY